MGWLFAVARGLQEGSRRAAWGTMTPLAVGHFAAIGAAGIPSAGLVTMVIVLCVDQLSVQIRKRIS
ncbi:MAG: hypothetical protein IH989_08495 [Planctomycetes bacterium]|nr:hypothetical protein [Planctomycetota bacterium]